MLFRNNKKKLGVFAFIICFMFFGVAAYSPLKEDPGPWKNLQVLPKDISKDSLDDIMDGFKKALGVKCTFCHVHEGEDFTTGWKWESDDKPEKQTARYMMKMTRGINETYFNFDSSARADTINVVSCMTCHRGIPHPDADDIKKQMEGDEEE